MKTCALCRRPAQPGFRYCFICKDTVRHQMEKDHYLTHVDPHKHRPPGSKEVRIETKDGLDL